MRRRHDLVCVVAPQNRGWILDGICRELVARVHGSAVVHVGDGPLPAARTYFFSHFLLYMAAAADRRVRRARSLVLFTHPSWGPDDEARVIESLEGASRIVSMSSLHADALVAAGLSADRVQTVLPGADPQRFRPHVRDGGPVGFCGAYYERKRPEVIVALVRAMPDRHFRLLGRGWREAGTLDAVLDASNFDYLETDYDQYPAFYDSIDVLVSPARLEGGPIPLIEAMLSNVVPIATKTGFAADLITDGVNGLLCPVDAEPKLFVDLIEEADTIDADIRATVEHLTWDRFASSVLEAGGVASCIE